MCAGWHRVVSLDGSCAQYSLSLGLQQRMQEGRHAGGETERQHAHTHTTTPIQFSLSTKTCICSLNTHWYTDRHTRLTHPCADTHTQDAICYFFLFKRLTFPQTINLQQSANGYLSLLISICHSVCILSACRHSCCKALLLTGC